MNDEQVKRISDAADAVMTASDSLDDARHSLDDRRFQSEAEKERLAAAHNLGSRSEAAAKRIDDALRKAVAAGAAAGRPGVYPRYRGAAAALADGRATIRSAMDQDGVANKREHARLALDQLDTALMTAASIVFGE